MKLTREQIGDIGENLVKQFFRRRGSEVIVNKDRYDTDKDMIIDGRYTEVKTQAVYREFLWMDGTLRPAFTVPISNLDLTKIYTNQSNKCLTVDRLIFVSRPSRYKKTIYFYEAPEPEKRVFHNQKNRKDGRIVAGILLSSLRKIGECTLGEKRTREFMDDYERY